MATPEGSDAYIMAADLNSSLVTEYNVRSSMRF